jgi:benzaldehyde dehydrogenase (NAD)
MALLDPDIWTGCFFDGQWRPAGSTSKSIEPATGEVLGVYGVTGKAELTESAGQAARAGRAWADLRPSDRAAVLHSAGRILEENAEEISQWITREAGKVSAAVQLEVQLTLAELGEAISLTAQPRGQLLPTAIDRVSMAERVPLGVVAVIAPWNFPLNLAMRSVAPALACGNAVILKPSSETVICYGVVIARVFEEAGLPAGVLHTLAGKGSELGTSFADDPNVDMISFTGSTPIGRELSEAAGRNLKRMVAELGGNNPFVVLDDVDVKEAAAAGAYGTFTHQGQICMAIGRHLVAESVAEEYTDELVRLADAMSVGDPSTSVDLGPIINESQAQHIDEIVQRTLKEGATLGTGGTRDGLFMRPTVLSGVDPTMAAYTEEFFGPVAAITTFKNDEEAVALANDSPFGLVSAVHSGSFLRARAVGDQLRAGMVHVNDQTVNDETVAPFGGRGDSGTGGTFGTLTNLDQFTTWRWVTLRSSQGNPNS